MHKVMYTVYVYSITMRKNQLIIALSVVILVFATFLVFDLSSTSAITGRIQINQYGSVTKHRLVTLFFNAPTGMDFQMSVANNISFDGAVWEQYKTSKQWKLPFGNGTHTVYVKFKSNKGNETKIFSDQIVLSVPEHRNVDFHINGDNKKTDSRNVVLTFEYSTGVELMAISNNPDLNGIEYQAVTDSLEWVLSEGAGTKTVYVEFKDGNGKTEIVERTIEFTAQDPELDAMSVVRTSNSPIYYVGFDGKLHPFTNLATYHTWYSDFDSVEVISPTLVKQYQIGNPMCVKAGTWLVKFKGVSRVYAPEPGCHLRPLRSDAEASILYGHDWKERVITLDFLESNFYSVRGFSVAKASENVYDGDHDGVRKSMEIEQGSSDSKDDTDGDGLTDYEEIYYWRSNPIKSDTDGDSYKDGDEVKKGFSPVGTGTLDSIPDGTYIYPHGATDGWDLFIIENSYNISVDQSLGVHDTARPNNYINNSFESL